MFRPNPMLYLNLSVHFQNTLPLHYTSMDRTQTGKPFHAPPWNALQKLDLVPKRDFIDLDLATADEDVVFVTGSSDNHFAESIAAVATARKLKPTWKVLYYDLGLNYWQIKQV